MQRGPIDRASSKGTCSVDPSIPSSADVQNPLKGGERLSYRRIAARIAELGFLLDLGHATSFGVLREMLIKLSRLHTFNQSVESLPPSDRVFRAKKCAQNKIEILSISFGPLVERLFLGP